MPPQCDGTKLKPKSEGEEEGPDTMKGNDKEEKKGGEEHHDSTSPVAHGTNQNSGENSPDGGDPSPRMEELALLMREQDADLLESNHFHGRNASRMEEEGVAEDGHEPNDIPSMPSLRDATCLEKKQTVDAERVGERVEARRISTGEGSEHLAASNDSIPTVDHRSQYLLSSAVETSLHSIPEIPLREDTYRRTLSGEIFQRQADAEREDGVALRPGSSDVSPADVKFVNEASSGDVFQREAHLKRSESTERRMTEALQFAEAVGDVPPSQQDEICIIDEEEEIEKEEDDEDDDDDVPEIHVDQQQAKQTESIPSQEALSAESAAVQGRPFSVRAASEKSLLREVPRTPVKTRPQWPFEKIRTKRGFLDKLPDDYFTAPSAGFVYKGIHANPPEIVKRGTTRGNYAQLHRKAWLEVSDMYHRYGKNLRLYYRYWERLGCPTNMFFDWLDSKGEAAGQPLPELDECPRSQLDSDTVLYITNPEVTDGYAVRFEPLDETRQGRVVDVDGDPVCTGPDGWIFVLRDNVMYGAQKVNSVSGHSKQRFHHSSFFGGKAVAAAGIFITDDDGILTRLYPHSGHYRPGEAHVQRVLFFLYHEGVDLRTFEMDTQQIMHVARDAKDVTKHHNQKADADTGGATTPPENKVVKKKKIESLHLMPAVLVACFLAHKARFIGEGIFAQIHKIRKANVTSVTEALQVIDDGGYCKRRPRSSSRHHRIVSAPVVGSVVA
jgi:hypothetical protein